MRLEFKIFLIITPILLLCNLLAYDLSEHTSIPHTLIYAIFIVLVSLILILLLRNRLNAKIQSLNSTPQGPIHSLDQAWELLQNMDSSSSNAYKLISEVSDMTSDSIIILDNKLLNIIGANTSARTILGKNITKSGITNVISDTAFLEALKLAQNKAYETKATFFLPSKNKSYLAVIKPHIWQGEIDRFIIVIRDVSKDLALESRIQEFKTNLNHELKTPITAILSASETIIQDDFSVEATKEFVPMIHKQAKKLVTVAKELNYLWTKRTSKT